MIKELLNKLEAKYPHYVIDNETYVKLCKETEKLFEEFFNLKDLSLPEKKIGCGKRFNKNGKFIFCGYPEDYDLCPECKKQSLSVPNSQELSGDSSSPLAQAHSRVEIPDTSNSIKKEFDKDYAKDERREL